MSKITMDTATRAAVFEGSIAYHKALENGYSIQEAEFIRLMSAQEAYDMVCDAHSHESSSQIAPSGAPAPRL